MAMHADVSRAADCDALIAETVRRFGRPDVLVNNAAETDTHRDWTSQRR
jgi:NAD(P)-dependent dehydrogenase (short-subunit alcohol dehydrogenase family)